MASRYCARILYFIMFNCIVCMVLGKVLVSSLICVSLLMLMLSIFRDRPKPISLVSAIAETVAETRDTYTAVTEP